MKVFPLLLVATLLFSTNSNLARSEQKQPKSPTINTPPPPHASTQNLKKPTLSQQTQISHPRSAPHGGALARILTRRTLRVCVRTDIPPFGYISSFGLVGLDIDLAKEVAVQLSVYYKTRLFVEWVVIEAKDRIPFLQNKRCDIVAASFSRTAERARQVAFSKTYLCTVKVILASYSSNRPQAVIGLVHGTTGKASQIKGITHYFHSYKDVVEAMSRREVDYVLLDRPIAVNILKNYVNTFRLYKELPQQEHYSIGVHLQHFHLSNAIDRAIGDLEKYGRISYLVRKWL